MLASKRQFDNWVKLVDKLEGCTVVRTTKRVKGGGHRVQHHQCGIALYECAQWLAQPDGRVLSGIGMKNFAGATTLLLERPNAVHSCPWLRGMHGCRNSMLFYTYSPLPFVSGWIWMKSLLRNYGWGAHLGTHGVINTS